jgi:hypothetical protein
MDLSGLTFGPIAPIVGAIVGACITAGVTYFFIYKRKVVTFWVSETEDLTLPLRQHHSFVRFKVGDSELVSVRPSGARQASRPKRAQFFSKPLKAYVPVGSWPC